MPSSSKPTNDVNAYYNRGVNRYKLGDNQGAIADYDQVIRMNPNYAKAYYNRGIARAALGNNQGAIADLQKAASLHKAQGNQTFYQRALEILQELGIQ
jgi:tetratricopeptide (TPR) repeat protein